MFAKILGNSSGKVYLTPDGKVLLSFSGTSSYSVDANGNATRISGELTGTEFSNIKTIGNNALYQAFAQSYGLTGTINFPVLTTIGDDGLNSTFIICRNITGANFPMLESVADRGMLGTLNGCNLTTISFPSLTTVGSYGMSTVLSNCNSLTTISFPSLTTINNNGLDSAFSYSKNVENVYFNSLTTTSFGSYNKQFNNMMSGTGNTITHTLHFPSNLETTISSLSGYPTFGGTSGYVVCAFDLPATE